MSGKDTEIYAAENAPQCPCPSSRPSLALPVQSPTAPSLSLCASLCLSAFRWRRRRSARGCQTDQRAAPDTTTACAQHAIHSKMARRSITHARTHARTHTHTHRAMVSWLARWLCAVPTHTVHSSSSMNSRVSRPTSEERWRPALIASSSAALCCTATDHISSAKYPQKSHLIASTMAVARSLFIAFRGR